MEATHTLTDDDAPSVPADQPYPALTESIAKDIVNLAKSAVRKLLGRPNEDLAQDIAFAAVRAWQRRQYDPRYKLATWVYQIAFRWVQNHNLTVGKKVTQDLHEMAEEIKSKSAIGRPRFFTPIQEHALREIARRESMGAKRMLRALREREDLRKLLGIHKAPGKSTLARALNNEDKDTEGDEA